MIDLECIVMSKTFREGYQLCCGFVTVIKKKKNVVASSVLSQSIGLVVTSSMVDNFIGYVVAPSMLSNILAMS